MEKIKVFYDKEGNTLNVWFGDPEKEHLCQETGEEIILVKDKEGKVIGFEKLNFLPLEVRRSLKELPVESAIT